MKILGMVCTVAFWFCGEICCHLGRHVYWWIVCGGVCHSGGDGSWSFYHVRNGGKKTYGMILIDSYRDCGGCCSYSCGHGVGIKSNCAKIFCVCAMSDWCDCYTWKMIFCSFHWVQACSGLACLMAEFYLGNP